LFDTQFLHVQPLKSLQNSTVWPETPKKRKGKEKKSSITKQKSPENETNKWIMSSFIQ